MSKTDEMIEFSRKMRYRTRKPRLDTGRDRSLRGKERVKARKAINKISKRSSSS